MIFGATLGLPVRFLLIDRLIELVPGERVLASSVIPTDLELFRDHFPGFPVMPGVLLTEMMGQAAAKCLDAQRLPRGKALLAKIQSAAFREWVRPGDQATLRANIVTNQALYASAECQLEVNARNAAEAKLMFTFMPIEKFAPGFSDAQLDEFLSKGKQ